MGNEKRDDENNDKKLPDKSREIFPFVKPSTRTESTSDTSLKRKHTDEIQPDSIKQSKHSEHHDVSYHRFPITDAKTSTHAETTGKNNNWQKSTDFPWSSSSSSGSSSWKEVEIIADTSPQINGDNKSNNSLFDHVGTSRGNVVASPVENKNRGSETNSIESFFDNFQHLEVYFNDIKRSVDLNYQAHVMTYLCNTYRYAFKTDLKRICKKYNFHLMPALNELFNEDKTLPRRQSKRQLDDMPEPSDDSFYLELSYIHLKENIDSCVQSEIDDILDQFSNKLTKFKTCDCCFEENLPPDEMLSCTDGHEFCKTCIRKLVKVNIDSEKFGFRCLNGYCEREFSLYTLQLALEVAAFSSLVSEVKKRNILIAGIADVVTCPSCSTNMMATDDDTLVYCINPPCRETTCKFCKQPNHLPNGCDNGCW